MVKAKNLYTGTIDSFGVTLWAVAWTWPLQGNIALTVSEVSAAIAAGGILTPATLDNFEGYQATTMVGDQVAEDSVTL